ncbi:hypothetical protein O9X98_06135 [Agrobacterium salinitolerans]|nr:hypothetical protein [Agrobacterium salinitolerans]
MRILSNTPEGKIVLNPPDILSLVSQSHQKSAAVVVIGRDVIVSTLYTDHNTMMAAAGFEVRNFDVEKPDPEAATFRGVMDLNGASFDVWHRGDQNELGNHLTSIKMAYDFLSSHWRLRNVGPMEVAIYDDDYVRTHKFDELGLTDERKGAGIDPQNLCGVCPS